MAKQIDYSKRVHLWSDGTWDEQGGNWIAVPQWHWQALEKLISDHGLKPELTKRLQKALNAP